MSLRTFAAIVGIFASQATARAEPNRPNVIVILADDLGYGDVGFNGCRDIPTPHLDRLAADGVRCASGYSSHPFCSPMRAGLLAGRYQQRFGYLTNIPYDRQNHFVGLPTSETTVPRRLQKAGYATGMVGKWHLGAAAPFHPTRRGFDFLYGFLGGGHQYFAVDLTKPVREGYFAPLHRNDRPENLDGYLTDRLTDEAVGFIGRRKDKPFYLYVAYNAPHTPMQAPPELLKKFASIKNKKRRAYAAMVHAMDRGVGRIMAAVAKHGLREKTLIFFLSDNGGPERANASDNGPLRDGKGSVYEGGIRVPFVACWPGTLPAGTIHKAPVISLDVSRTALAVAGVDPGAKADGVDLIPVLTGKKPASRKALFWNTEGGKAWAVRAGDWKLVHRSVRPGPELYNLAADVGEKKNVADDHTETVAELRRLHGEWAKGNVPSRFPNFRGYHGKADEFYKSLNRGK